MKLKGKNSVIEGEKTTEKCGVGDRAKEITFGGVPIKNVPNLADSEKEQYITAIIKCKTCKAWNGRPEGIPEQDYNTDLKDGFASCMGKIPFAFFSVQKPHDATLAYMWDSPSSATRAGLRTHPDFGCVLWEEK